MVPAVVKLAAAKAVDLVLRLSFRCCGFLINSAIPLTIGNINGFILSPYFVVLAARLIANQYESIIAKSGGIS